MTTLPVTDFSSSVITSQIIPQFADGGGWTTEVVLVNPASQDLLGTIQWLGQTGQPILPTSGYTLPAGSSKRFVTEGRDATIQIGSIRVSPGQFSGQRGGITPSVTGIFTFRSRGVMVTQAGVPGVITGSAFRLFVEANDSLRTGVAIANGSATAAAVNLELFKVDGTPSGLSGSLSIPSAGQLALFLNEVPGFTTMPAVFQGLLRITSVNSIAVTGLRGHYNERGDFLITTTVVQKENDPSPVSSELLFPHFVLGGGYETQFVLFSPRLQNSSGRVFFFDQNGTPMALVLR